MIEFLPNELADALEKLDLHIEVPHEIPELKTLLNETVLAGGKRFRPSLCFMMGGILGASAEQVAPYARVAELMHAATLAHDDVIDEATKRRNRPTLNKIATNQKAVLTGDLLLARVVYEIASLGNLDILRDGAQVLEDLVRGEWLQINRRGNATPTRAMLEQAAQKKTSSLIAWCCTTPARLSGASPQLLELCQNLGNRVGLAFQMADDILDFEKEGEKPYANDLLEGLVNFVVLDLIEQKPGLAPQIQQLLDSGIAANPCSSPTELSAASEKISLLKAWPWSEQELDAAKASVREKVRALIHEARKDLEMISQLSTECSEKREHVTQALDLVLTLMAERVR